MSQLLIGLAGKARTGKDTVARYLAAHLSLISYAFADPLKQALAGMFHLTAAQLEGAEKEQPLPWLGKAPRELMQLLGTDLAGGIDHMGNHGFVGYRVQHLGQNGTHAGAFTRSQDHDVEGHKLAFGT